MGLSGNGAYRIPQDRHSSGEQDYQLDFRVPRSRTNPQKLPGNYNALSLFLLQRHMWIEVAAWTLGAESALVTAMYGSFMARHLAKARLEIRCFQAAHEKWWLKSIETSVQFCISDWINQVGLQVLSNPCILQASFASIFVSYAETRHEMAKMEMPQTGLPNRLQHHLLSLPW